MFLGSDNGGGGHDDERENRASLVPAAKGGGGGGGAHRDGDGEEARARQPGCFTWAAFWRRRRARITAASTDTDTTEQPRPDVIALDGHLVGIGSSTGDAIPEMECRVGMNLGIRNVAAEEEGARTDAMVPGQAEERTELPREIDCIIVSKLLSFSDRSKLEVVSRRWRSATKQCLSPPLPIILNADLTMTNWFADGPKSVPLQMIPNDRHPRDHQITCLGSLGSLIILAYDYWNPNVNLALPHSHCVLVQPVNGSTITLPNPCASELEGVSVSVPIVSGNGSFNLYQPVKTCSLRLKKAVVSQSTNPSGCIVAALATERGAHHIVFTTPLMSSWYISSADFITVGADIEFLGDKIIVLGSNQEELFQIDFGTNLSFFPVVCEIKRSGVESAPD